jgi:hypothetical protein
MAKYEGQPVMAQAEAYTKNGHPRSYGLWATGCMAWRRGPWNERIGAAWIVQQTWWSYQDQISWPVVVRDQNVDVSLLPGGLWDRTYVEFRAHASNA